MKNVESAEAMEQDKVKVGDRVVLTQKEGLQGSVKGVHFETTAKAEQRDKALMIEVMWDNGTLSYVTPEQLKLVDAP